VTAGQLTVSDAATFENVGAPGAAGRVATEEVARPLHAFDALAARTRYEYVAPAVRPESA
jgi:hypothetical protein